MKGKIKKTCAAGHVFYKSSDCPTCPVCEKKQRPDEGFLALLPAPARRALELNGITTVKQLGRFSEREILLLHGIGPASLPVLREALRNKSLAFKNTKQA